MVRQFAQPINRVSCSRLIVGLLVVHVLDACLSSFESAQTADLNQRLSIPVSLQICHYSCVVQPQAVASQSRFAVRGAHTHEHGRPCAHLHNSTCHLAAIPSMVNAAFNNRGLRGILGSLLGRHSSGAFSPSSKGCGRFCKTLVRGACL